MSKPLLAASKGGAGWSSAIAISPANLPDPTRGSQLNDIAVNANGVAVAAWDQAGSYDKATGTYNWTATIGVAVQSGGRWGAPFTISGNTNGYATTPKVAVGADGTMAVSWIYQDDVSTTPSPRQKIQVAVKAPSRAWTTSTLAEGPVGGVAITQSIPVAVDNQGNVTAVWSLWNGTIHEIQSAMLPKDGSWPAPEHLAPVVDGIFPSLAINSRGDAAVAFVVSAWSYSPTNAQYVFRSGSGAWSSPAVVSETLTSNVGYITNPVVALDANGLATVAYFGYGVEAVRQLTETEWTKPTTVLSASYSGSSYGSIELATDQTGNAVLAASIFDATVNVDRSSVWVSLGTPEGTWSYQERLTDPTVPVDAYASRVAVSPDGALVLVGWIDHYHGEAQVSQLNTSSGMWGAWGAARTIGRGTAFGSFQEVMGLDAASDPITHKVVARAIWKSTAKGGTLTMAASYN